ncbi:hypothetical protein WA026_015955 [Henosepilachna vigintioctopunctata]|uniref:Uncharacterized protein n=1 Tax=Henosepilachna vigintioctopunctata TaxID=420089 RepID=A0AAW1UA66_9CUCU
MAPPTSSKTPPTEGLKNEEGTELFSFLKDGEDEGLPCLELDENYSENFELPSDSSSSCGNLCKYPTYVGIGLNKTFNDTRLRDIERDNSILMTKIMSKTRRPKQYKTYQQPQIKSSFDINRKKAQAKIEYENRILFKKIQAVKPGVKY